MSLLSEAKALVDSLDFDRGEIISRETLIRLEALRKAIAKFEHSKSKGIIQCLDSLAIEHPKLQGPLAAASAHIKHLESMVP